MHLDNLNPDTFVNIIENLYDGLYVVDRNRIITYWNRAAERISGFKAEEVVGHSCSENILTHMDDHGRQLCFGQCPLAKCMSDVRSQEAEVYMHHRDGHRIPVLVRTSVLTDAAGNVAGGIELFTDISNQKANALKVAELEKLALLDALTELANRVCMERELMARIEEKRRLNVPFGLFFIDLDNFKQFNDQYGHDVGDRVLKFVAKTFVANSRPFDIYGRWGGEEFLGIVRNITPENLKMLGERLGQLVQNSYIAYDGQRLCVTISIGATMVNDDDDVESLVKRADRLLYESKHAGRNRLTMG